MKKFKREYKLSKMEFYIFQLNQIINSELIILNKTDIVLLAYVHVHGINVFEEILKDRILTNHNAVLNYVARLTKQGYLIKEYNSDTKAAGRKKCTNIYLNPELKISDEDFIQVSIVQVDPNLDELYHPNYRK